MFAEGSTTNRSYTEPPKMIRIACGKLVPAQKLLNDQQETGRVATVAPEESHAQARDENESQHSNLCLSRLIFGLCRSCHKHVRYLQSFARN